MFLQEKEHFQNAILMLWDLGESRFDEEGKVHHVPQHHPLYLPETFRLFEVQKRQQCQVDS
jgi:hypothetical protein